MMQRTSGSLIEWLIPLAFIFCAGWAIWHMPAYILTWFPHENESMFGQVSAIFDRNDVTPNLTPLFGKIDIVDLVTLLLVPVLFIAGAMTVRRANMEFEHWRSVDRAAMFIGRVTMMLVVLLTSVMLYEVFLRYVLERPTLWANELSLWLAGFVFLMAGLYAMQQRSHIRIFLLYDVCPRWVQRLFDCITTVLIVMFAFFLVYGSYKQVFENKLYKWETFGTAFDPPIPATLQPLVLIMISLVAVQAVLNLISDWNAEPEIHDDTPDEDEIQALKRAVGQD
ncbi:TRAP transporter small permease [Roseobacter denitrificans]|uniref:TRAP transporter small permease subunit n=1 Tax=Roseobacter denitrificans TaxID=2434 RepID=UPI0002FEC603|nr:TRAP transporter small permease [Roseobacter denitrificans]AVL53536.1 TRAP transporter small permease [Roseobacter denitrificans]